MSVQRCAGCNEPLTSEPEWIIPPDSYCCSMECYLDALFEDPDALEQFLDDTHFDELNPHLNREECFPILKGHKREILARDGSSTLPMLHQSPSNSVD